MRRGLCEETVEEDIDERSFARLFFFFLLFSRSLSEACRKSVEKGERKGGSDKEKKS